MSLPCRIRRSGYPCPFAESVMGGWFVFDIVSFILLDTVGIPGNLHPLYSFTHMLMCQGRSIPSEIILSKLAFSNLLVILTQGIPFTLKTFRLQNMYNGLVCKVTLHVYCVAEPRPSVSPPCGTVSSVSSLSCLLANGCS